MNDLEHLNYFGYRGEALASLRIVTSLLEIVSRPKGSCITYSKCFQKGEAFGATQLSTHRPSQGTTVTAHDLFYNLPVRRNGLNLGLEVEKIRFRVAGIALMWPKISITLRDDSIGSIILQTQKCSGVKASFSQLFTPARAKGLMEVNYERGNLKISGVVNKESYSRKDLQFVFVNKRLVLKSSIHKQVNKIFRRSLILRKKGVNAEESEKIQAYLQSINIQGSPPKQVDQYAIYALNVECPFRDYDITFDPSKTLVEFRDWPKVIHSLQDMLYGFLRRENLLAGNIYSPTKLDKYEGFEKIAPADGEDDPTDKNDLVNCHRFAIENLEGLFSAPISRSLQSKRSNFDRKKEKQDELEEFNLNLSLMRRKTSKTDNDDFYDQSSTSKDFQGHSQNYSKAAISYQSHKKISFDVNYQNPTPSISYKIIKSSQNGMTSVKDTMPYKDIHSVTNLSRIRENQEQLAEAESSSEGKSCLTPSILQSSNYIHRSLTEIDEEEPLLNKNKSCGRTESEHPTCDTVTYSEDKRVKMITLGKSSGYTSSLKSLREINPFRIHHNPPKNVSKMMVHSLQELKGSVKKPAKCSNDLMKTPERPVRRKSAEQVQSDSYLSPPKQQRFETAERINTPENKKGSNPVTVIPKTYQTYNHDESRNTDYLDSNIEQIQNPPQRELNLIQPSLSSTSHSKCSTCDENLTLRDNDARKRTQSNARPLLTERRPQSHASKLARMMKGIKDEKPTDDKSMKYMTRLKAFTYAKDAKTSSNNTKGIYDASHKERKRTSVLSIHKSHSDQIAQDVENERLLSAYQGYSQSFEYLSCNINAHLGEKRLRSNIYSSNDEQDETSFTLDVMPIDNECSNEVCSSDFTINGFEQSLISEFNYQNKSNNKGQRTFCERQEEIVQIDSENERLQNPISSFEVHRESSTFDRYDDSTLAKQQECKALKHSNEPLPFSMYSFPKERHVETPKLRLVLSLPFSDEKNPCETVNFSSKSNYNIPDLNIDPKQLVSYEKHAHLNDPNSPGLDNKSVYFQSEASTNSHFSLKNRIIPDSSRESYVTSVLNNGYSSDTSQGFDPKSISSSFSSEMIASPIVTHRTKTNEDSGKIFTSQGFAVKTSESNNILSESMTSLPKSSDSQTEQCVSSTTHPCIKSSNVDCIEKVHTSLYLEERVKPDFDKNIETNIQLSSSLTSSTSSYLSCSETFFCKKNNESVIVDAEDEIEPICSHTKLKIKQSENRKALESENSVVGTVYTKILADSFGKENGLVVNDNSEDLFSSTNIHTISSATSNLISRIPETVDEIKEYSPCQSVSISTEKIVNVSVSPSVSLINTNGRPTHIKEKKNASSYVTHRLVIPPKSHNDLTIKNATCSSRGIISDSDRLPIDAIPETMVSEDHDGDNYSKVNENFVEKERYHEIKMPRCREDKMFGGDKSHFQDFNRQVISIENSSSDSSLPCGQKDNVMAVAETMNVATGNSESVLLNFSSEISLSNLKSSNVNVVPVTNSERNADQLNGTMSNNMESELVLSAVTSSEEFNSDRSKDNSDKFPINESILSNDSNVRNGQEINIEMPCETSIKNQSVPGLFAFHKRQQITLKNTATMFSPHENAYTVCLSDLSVMKKISPSITSASNVLMSEPQYRNNENTGSFHENEVIPRTVSDLELPLQREQEKAVTPGLMTDTSVGKSHDKEIKDSDMVTFSEPEQSVNSNNKSKSADHEDDGSDSNSNKRWCHVILNESGE